MTPHPIPAWVDGRLTPVDKLEAHQKGLKHKAISVFVWDGGRMLLQKRAEGKYHTPGLWTNTCCTHPMWHEDTITCARRRLREELGITGLTPRYKGTVEYRADVGGGLIEHEVVDIYFAEASGNLSTDLNPDEVSEIAWATLDQLRGRIAQDPTAYTPWLKIYLQRHASLFDEIAAE